ncbi:MAG: T9SS type A sorting domain-containing protein [bacterium]
MFFTNLNNAIWKKLYDFINKYKVVKLKYIISIFIIGLIAVSFSTNSNAQIYLIDHNGDKYASADTVPPYIPVYIPDDDGSAQGQVIDMPDDDAIRSNLGNIFKSLDDNFNFDFDEYEPGVDRQTNWYITVKDKFKDAAGSVRFSDWAGNSVTETFRYIAPKFRLSPNDFNFGEVVTGDDRPYTEFVITNESYDRKFVLEKLELKDGKKGFEIVFLKNTEGYLNGPNKIFEPQESLKFRVYFNPTIEGNFSDSIGIGTSYAFAYTARVRAEVASPVIVADDLNFFDITIGDTMRKSVSVHNKGLVPLYLKSYLSTRLPFWTTLPQITENENYLISPGGRLNFEIFFAPDSLGYFKDSVIFFSNATGKDAVTYIYGHGVKPGLIVSSYDWGRKRIKPGQPYTSYENAVWLTNTAQDSITIYNIEKIDTINAYAFEFVEGEFQNLKLAPRQSKQIEVAFNPIEVGYHEMTLVYKNSMESESKSVFKGIGVAPKISTSDVNFDTSLVNDVFTPVSRRVIFRNENWDYADILYIDSIMILPNGDEISVDTSVQSKPYGTEGFKIFNADKPGPPWLIEKGDSLVFDINYVAQKEGPASAAIRSVSDALWDTTSHLTGTGMYSWLKTFTTPATIVACVNDVDTVYYHIENHGRSDITIDSIRLFDNDSFYFTDSTILNGFDIISFEKKVFPVVFAPKREETLSTNIFAYHTYSGILKEEKATINTQSFFTEKSLTSRITNEDTILNIGEVLSVKVFIDQGEDISFYKLKDFDVRVEFNPNFLAIGKENIIPGEIIKSGFFKPEKEKINIDYDKGIITFPINAHSNGYLTGDGEILKYEFQILPPKQADSIYQSTIITYLTTSGNHCVEFNHSNTLTITLDSYLTNNLEWLDFNGSRNKLLDIYPNPAYSVNPHVNFEIKEEGYYEIKLFNPLGQFVASIVSTNLRPGNYRATLPVLNQPTGVYTCLLINSHFTIAKKFVFIR